MKISCYCSFKLRFVVASGAALLLGASIALAAVVSDVRASKHNLSSATDGSATPSGVVPVRTVKATSETRVCVFCHTPHSASGGAISGMLWNRSLSTATYTPYLSSSTDADPIPGVPGSGSKVCLSCHDGTMAIGMVSVLNLVRDVPITVTGTNFVGGMPEGDGAQTGFTRYLDSNLGNDHPISFNYDATLGGVAGTDGELRSPPVVVGLTTVVGNRTAGVKPTYPLDSNQMQCPTCHDPHLSETDPAKPALKFLRGNRLQVADPLGGAYAQADDIMCLACHDKAGTTWSNSAHANSLVATQSYVDADATLREFPLGTQVWEASCLNCHDTHSVQGSRHLLREGTDSLLTPKTGGNPAIEETCYQCHSAFGVSIITPLTSLPDIKSDFALPIRMPINNTDQGVSSEAHDIGGEFDDSVVTGDPNAHCLKAIGTDRCGKDLVESQTALGRKTAPPGVDIALRHTECTDCHNPHRVTKTRLFNDDATPPIVPAAAGTHKHNIVAGDTVSHSNIASGVLRGITGVEPAYSSNEFGANASGFTVKRGDGGIAASDQVSSSWVTREYQTCLKCHSNYAYDLPAGPPVSVITPPLSLGTYGGGTATTTNGMIYYTDVAMESQAPSAHQGSPISTADSGAFAPTFSGNNHRSWHPVMDITKRDSAARGGANPNLWRAPWNGSNIDGGALIVTNYIDRTLGSTPFPTDAIGYQTMYCSDCHGSSNGMADGSNPFGGEDGNSWGPHGSSNEFVLKGPWNTTAAVGVATDMLCSRCHDSTQYADATGAAPTMNSGFGHATNLDPLDGITPLTNLHQRHAYYATLLPAQAPSWPSGVSYRCTLCHTGTAHGWKNKGFLVNLDDLGPELNMTGGALGGTLETPNLAIGAAVPKGTQATGVPYTNGPYYQGAYLKVTQFKAGGTWLKTDCTGGCH